MKEINREKGFAFDKVTYETENPMGPQRRKEEIEPHFARVSMVFSAIIFIAICALIAPDFVGAGEVGIISRFGKINRLAESGLNFHIPFIEKITKMNVCIQKDTVTVGAATKDMQDLSATMAVTYSMNHDSILEIYKQLGKEYADVVLSPAVSETFKQVSSKYTAEGVIANRTELKEGMLASLKPKMEVYGIVVSDVNITDLNFSAEYNEAIEAKAVAKQEVERAQQELERVKVEAESKIEAARAEAEAQRLQQQTLTKEMIQKMWVEKWNGELPATMTGDNGVMLNLGQ